MTDWKRGLEELSAHGCVLLKAEYDARQGRGYFVYAYHGPEVEPGPITRHWRLGGMYLSVSILFPCLYLRWPSSGSPCMRSCLRTSSNRMTGASEGAS